MIAGTREAWLIRFVETFRPCFDAKTRSPLPVGIRAATGWPLGCRPKKHSDRPNTHVIGECWASKASQDSTSEIFVSPMLDSGIAVAEVLVHELIHAADDCKNGHRGPFKRMAKAIVLIGPMRATTAGPELRQRLNGICDQLGPYPHAALTPSLRKKQGTRLVKVVCSRRPVCKYCLWTTRMWLDVGTPTCPCGSAMSEVTR